MSLTIVVRGSGSSKRPRFTPHFNRELGKKYYSEKSYYSDMKRAGLEPYDPSSIKKFTPSPYVQTKWAKDMLRDVTARKGRAPGGRFVEELAKRGYTQKRSNEARRLADEIQK